MHQTTYDGTINNRCHQIKLLIPGEGGSNDDPTKYVGKYVTEHTVDLVFNPTR